MKKLPTIYKRAQTGAIRHWTVEISDTGYRAVYGQEGGKTTTSEWYLTEATNVGRANQRNVAEQAEFEAQALWHKKLEASGWMLDKNAVDDESNFLVPMLADKWEKRKDKVSFPVYSQPKLDGMRAVICQEGAFSRNGKKWVTIPHIKEQLAPIFEKYPDIAFDGELYNHKLKEDFNKIASLAKKTKPTEKDLEESAKMLQYWIYDVIGIDKNFKERYDWIFQNVTGSSIQVVATDQCNDIEELDTWYGSYIECGFEGQIVRIDKPYEHKRSKHLLKRKEFMDSEFRIVSIGEGNGNKKGMAGFAYLEREDGVQFRSNIKGQHSFLEELWHNRHNIVGKYATCQYFHLTPDGIPRFPYIIKIRDGKGID